MAAELLTPLNFLVLAGIGAVAGLLGGLLGVGGSIIMIPALTIAFGPDQQLYQAAAMIANVGIAVPAALRHRRAKAMVPEALRWMGPAALVTVITGVYISNHVPGVVLSRILAGFMLYVVGTNLLKLRPGARLESLDTAKLTSLRGLSVGAAMGTTAGLLGIGGGAVATPLQQTLLKLPLRNAIANSSAIIGISAAIGAIYKNASLASLPHHDYAWYQGLTLALCLIPTALLASRLGAGLTHRLPLVPIRVIFILLLSVAAWKMADLPLG